MDPFTEVRDFAGAVNHDPCGPLSAPAVSLRPTGRQARRVRSASVQPGGSRGVAASQALLLPRKRGGRGELQTLGYAREDGASKPPR